ncbi:MAG: hypothetical protein KA715_07945 [Xanthomonadaceae bacterium]|nr:hypothetical protein [Xanthomonadaceae bacterium]
MILDSKELIGFCDQLDQILTRGRGAKRNKNSINYAYVIASTLKDVARDSKNLRWFADQIDALYTFWQE